MLERLQIEIDESLADIVPGFLLRKREDLCVIMNEASVSNFDAIARMAHRLKGEGGSYGFDELSVIARLIEERAKAGDRIGIAQLVARACDYLDRVDVVYKSMDD